MTTKDTTPEQAPAAPRFPSFPMPALELRLNWHLDDLLKTHNIKRYHFQQFAGISANTVMSLCKDSNSRIDIPSTQNILNALRAMTGKDIALSDLVSIQVSATSDTTPSNGLAINAKPLFDNMEGVAPAASAEAQQPAPKASKRPKKAAQPEAQPLSCSDLIEQAKAQGLTVYVFPGTGVNAAKQFAIAAAHRNEVIKLTGLTKHAVYSAKTVEDPEDYEALSAALAKPKEILSRKLGSSDPFKPLAI